MATYYVDPVSGSDANDGTAPTTGGGHGPWLTIGKALGAAGIASGDTVYVKGGTTIRETVTVNMVSAVAETKVYGDVDGTGFAAGGDPNPTTGLVRWTAHTTNDKTAPAAAAAVNLNGRDFLTFRDFQFNGGNNANGGCVQGTTTQSTDIKFDRCVFLPGATVGLVRVACAADSALNWTITNCMFFSVNNNCVRIDPATSAVADYDMNVQINNCTLNAIGSSPILVAATGANAFGGGGVDTFNNTIVGGSGVQTTGTTGTAANKQVYVYNSAVVASGTAFNAAAVNQMVEDYNVFYGTHGANVATGANTQGSATPYAYAFLADIGQSTLQGKAPRPFLTPQEGSPWLGFGAQAGGPTVDIFGYRRPSGGQSPNFAAGSMERPNTFVRETTTVRTGSNALSITGPGSYDFQLPVDPVETTISVWSRRDGVYNGSVARQRMQVLNGAEVGVADATDTATGVANVWEELTLTFTPTKAGYVTVRFLSSDVSAGGNGKMFVDDFSVT